MIVYGWNNFCLKTLTSRELGMKDDDADTAKIQYRIKYVHLFWIPIFPIGTYWTVNVGGKQFEPSAELKEALQHADKSNFKWIFSWSGILITLLIIGGIQASEKITRMQYEKRAENSKALLISYFKDTEKNKPLANKLQFVYALADTVLGYVSVDAVAPEAKGSDAKIVDFDEIARMNEHAAPIDTSRIALLQLYINTFASKVDSLIGLNEENTLFISKIDDNISGMEYNHNIPEYDIFKAVKSGNWTVSQDTESVFSVIRNFDQKKYIAVVKELKRNHPDINGDNFTGGYSLCKVAVYDLEAQKLVTTFQQLSENSDEVTSYGSKSESGNNASLEGDLNRNIMKDIKKYLFHTEEEEVKPKHSKSR